MDNKFIDRDLIERYVRQQLNEEELAIFRGRLMFEADLRKQVVETKMLFNGLAAIAKEGGYISPPKVAAPSSAAVRSYATRYRIAAFIGALLLVGSLSYYWSLSAPADNPVKPSSNIPIVDSQPQVDKTETEANEVDKEENSVEFNNIATNPADNSNTKNNTKNTLIPTISPRQSNPTIPTKNNRTNNNDKGNNPKIFAKSTKKVKTDFSDEDIAFAAGSKTNSDIKSDDSFTKNDFLEDQITNATTKSKSLISDVQLKYISRLNRDKHGSVSIKCKGNILNSKGKSFVFKIFNNKTEDYINNSQKYQHHFTTNSGNASNTFKVSTRIDLPPGLYYYIIEEDMNGEEDMIFAGKFRVTNN